MRLNSVWLDNIWIWLVDETLTNVRLYDQWLDEL